MGERATEIAAKRWTYVRTAEVIADLLKKIDPKQRIRTERVFGVTWHGSPRRVHTKLGRFTRGVFRDDVTAEQVSKLNPSDVHPGGFEVEDRLRRVTEV